MIFKYSVKMVVAAIITLCVTTPCFANSKKAIEILGTMLGGFNIQFLISALEDAEQLVEAWALEHGG